MNEAFSPRQQPPAHLRGIVFGAAAFFALAIIALLIWRKLFFAQGPLPILGHVPRFILIERSGQPFSRAELDGNIWIADFIFTNCGGTCPIMTTAMSEIQAKLIEQEMDDVKLVSISVDPERDTPEVLSRFANGYGADPQRWYFLTGEGAAIQKLAKEGFHLAAATGGGSPEEPIIHSNRFVLVDGQARIRGYYDGTDEQAVQKLVQDLKSLYKTRQPS